MNRSKPGNNGHERVWEYVKTNLGKGSCQKCERMENWRAKKEGSPGKCKRLRDECEVGGFMA